MQTRTTSFGVTRGGGRRRRGSAIVLVVVSLILMVLLGAVYLQTARVQRLAGGEVPNDMDLVIEAIITNIAEILRADLEDPGDDSFELYDYPWTNYAETWEAKKYDSDGTSRPFDAAGNFTDDIWLASSEPDFTSGMMWPHITNLNGVFLEYEREDGSGNPLNRFVVDGGTGLPVQHEVRSGNPEERDRNIAQGEADWQMMTDTDGDGIPDSRWTWAPETVWNLNGMYYVMAVRIEDLSAKVNVNTALSLGRPVAGGGWEYDVDTDAPRWDTPSEVDFGRFVLETGGSGLELRRQIERRAGTDLGVLVDRASRVTFWEEIGRYYRQPNVTGAMLFGTTDEFELRHGNGLNISGKAVTPLETEMEFFLRARTQESGITPTFADEQDFFENDPRHQMTTMSGATIFAWPLPGVEFAPNGDPVTHLKLDLNGALDTAIKDRVEEIYNYNTPSPLPGGIPTTTELATQFVANLMDYKDDDSQISEFDGRHGMEYLPFIAEIYVQALYTATTTGGAAGAWEVTWDREPVGSTGYAIEIRNPFDVEIPLDQVMLRVDGVDWGMLSSLPLAPPALGAGEVLVITRNSSGGAAADDDVAGLVIGADHTVDTSGDPAFDWPTGQDVVVELLAPVMYSRATVLDVADQYIGTSASATDPNGRQTYGQRWTVGSGEGLNTVALLPQPQFSSVNPALYGDPQDTDGNPPRDTDTDTLGEAVKLAGPISSPDAEQLILRNDPDGRIHHVGELAHLLILGPTTSPSVQSVAEVWGAASSSDEFRLNLDPAATPIEPSLDAYNLPHGAFLLGQFATLSPMHDGADNDGDGRADENGADIDNDGTDEPADDDEFVVRGLINLNTASPLLLARVLPIPEQMIREQVAARIAEYRSNPGVRNAAPYWLSTPRANAGIAHTGELYPIMKDFLADAAWGTAGDTQELPQTSGAPVRIDFLNEDHPTPDAVAEDAEERAMIGKWLSQVGTVRSDFFAAHVQVRAYDGIDQQGDGQTSWEDTDPNEGAAASQGFIAIFKRDLVSGQVRCVAVMHNGERWYNPN